MDHLLQALCRKVLFVAAIFPMLWIFGVLLFLFRARNYLGFWPKLYHPDPKTLPFEFHREILIYGMYGVFATLGMMLVLRILFKRFKDFKRSIFLFKLGWILILITTFIPPLDFVAWFLD